MQDSVPVPGGPGGQGHAVEASPGEFLAASPAENTGMPPTTHRSCLLPVSHFIPEVYKALLFDSMILKLEELLSGKSHVVLSHSLLDPDFSWIYLNRWIG